MYLLNSALLLNGIEDRGPKETTLQCSSFGGGGGVVVVVVVVVVVSSSGECNNKLLMSVVQYGS